ncbi:MAG TPA: HK97 family phage prohead protease [Holosporales bacterium]|nr:HK97 family phage prohead protease [Holosporales bacterium]
MRTKTHKLCIKNLSEDGCFEGYASVFNFLDHHGESVKKGAFKNSLSARSVKGLKMLWQHDQNKPIGVWEEAREDAYGLYVKGRLLMEVPQAKEAYAFLKAGVIEGLSIGYNPVHSYFDENKKVKFLTEVDLLEISLVTFAANEKAKVVNVKNLINIKKRLQDLQGALEHLAKTVATSTVLY